MYFLALGVVLLIMKSMEIDPVATWSWLTVLAPFGLAAAWWAWADSSGYTKRRAMEVEQARVKARVQRNREAMGALNTKKKER
jgi:small Trp-rich protein